MSDLVKRLRKQCEPEDPTIWVTDVMEAADRIETLAAENDLLKSSKKVTEDMVAHQTEQFHIERKKALDLEAENARYRAALSEIARQFSGIKGGHMAEQIATKALEAGE